MKAKFNVVNSVKYVLGLALLSLSVALSFRAGFGGSAPDNLTFILSKVLKISLGTGSFLICSLIILFLTAFFKNLKFLFLFLQVIVFSPLLDFWDLAILGSYQPSGGYQIATFIFAILLMPLANVILIKTTYPAGVYDELMFFTAKVTRLKLPVARLLNELLIVGIALAVSYATGNGSGSVQWGTFVFALTIGILIKLYIILFDKIKSRRIKNGNQ